MWHHSSRVRSVHQENISATKRVQSSLPWALSILPWALSQNIVKEQCLMMQHSACVARDSPKLLVRAHRARRTHTRSVHRQEDASNARGVKTLKMLSPEPTVRSVFLERRTMCLVVHARNALQASMRAALGGRCVHLVTLEVMPVNEVQQRVQSVRAVNSRWHRLPSVGPVMMD